MAKTLSESMRDTLNKLQLEEQINTREVEQRLHECATFTNFIKTVIDSNTGVVDVYASSVKIRQSIDGKLPVQFGDVPENFYCDKVPGLTSLQGLPTLECINLDISGNPGLINLAYSPLTVHGRLECCDNDNLQTLDGMPHTIKEFFSCVKNPSLTSLKGIEPNSNIDIMWITYNANLPMLRLLCTNELMGFYSEPRGDVQKEYNNLTEIINFHIKKYSDMKERILKCKFAMRDAGYKNNAKW